MSSSIPTIEQKQRFESAFNDLLKKAPQELQDQWSGFVGWGAIGNPFFINMVHLKLKDKLAADFFVLMEKLRARSI